MVGLEQLVEGRLIAPTSVLTGSTGPAPTVIIGNVLSVRAKRLLTEALELADEERAELTDELARTLPLGAEWLDELDHRADEIDDGTVELVAGEDAHARVGAHLDTLTRR